MTRDEVKAVITARHRQLAISLTDEDLSEIADSDIDIWLRLGMLKLDEPKKPAADVALEAIRDAFARHGRAICSLDVLVAIQSRGLKIVEK